MVAYSVSAPAGVNLPMRLALNSVNQRFPSRPAVMLSVPGPSVLVANLVTSPEGLTRRIQSGSFSPLLRPSTHMLWSGPAAIVWAPPASGTGIVNWTTWPEGLIRPTRPRPPSTYHMLPSGPAARLPRVGRQGLRQVA